MSSSPLRLVTAAQYSALSDNNLQVCGPRLRLAGTRPTAAYKYYYHELILVGIIHFDHFTFLLTLLLAIQFNKPLE